MPAEAGIQLFRISWIPRLKHAGMTRRKGINCGILAEC